MHTQRIRYSRLVNLLLVSGILVWASIEEAGAQRRGGGGGGTRQSIGASRGGGGGGAHRAQAANRGGGQMAANRGGGQAAGNRGAQARSGVDRANAGNRGDIGSGNRVDNSNRNTNVNRGSNNNINIDNDINIDADNGWGNDWDYHPVAAGVAFGTAAAITSAAIGSMYYSLPPSCAPRPYNSISYYYCGNAWYMPQYAGTSVTYTVVNPPY